MTEERYMIYNARTIWMKKFIVGLQKVKQDFFRKRAIYYSTFPISEQAEKGIWNYNLKAVFCIGLLDFTFNDYANGTEKREIVHWITLKDQNGKPFYNKLTYIYLEMPNFEKGEKEIGEDLGKEKRCQKRAMDCCK